MTGKSLKKEFGDYQTPIEFATKICDYIKNKLGENPSVIIEPTCGIGNFIKSSLVVFDNVDSVKGIEINFEYIDICKKNNDFDDRLDIYNDNFFTFDTRQFQNITDDNTLIIGNPPWATNSNLKYNLPVKINFKRLKGLDAMTGASNFDICEYIILKLIDEFKGTNNMISMLCKTSVARNIFRELNKNDIGVEYIKIVEFDANKIFGISASACALVLKLSSYLKNYRQCEVFDIDNIDKVKDIIECKNGVLSSVLNQVEDFDGECEFIWRQGVKHDCSKIMELRKNEDGTYTNGKKEIINIEDTFVFPLMKSSFFKEPIIKNNYKKYVIVTQRKARQETRYMEKQAEKTWKYLNDNKEAFERRKSSIYKGAPLFSMFGVGDYSYARYKVGVSGFYKKALFCMVYNENDIEHPVMGDDTCYFLAFDDKEIAYVCMLLLNSPRVQNYLVSISFKDAKRPYTKKVLNRISIRKCVNKITLDELRDTEKMLKLDEYITKEMYQKLKNLVNVYQMSMES